MQTLSSASRTFIALASAVECTATVLIPMSRQARWMRNAISPRLAIRTFSNMPGKRGAARRALFDQHQRAAVLDRLGVADKDPGDAAAARRADLVHHLHRLDDQQDLPFADRIADPNVRRRTRLRREIGDPDQRRFQRAGMIDAIGRMTVSPITAAIVTAGAVEQQ